MIMKALFPAFLIAVAVTVAGCGSGGTSLSSSPGTTAKTKLPPELGKVGSANVNYHPKIVPASFSANITNHYFPLQPGTQHVLVGLRDGVKTKHVQTVLGKTKTIIGVRCAVIHDRVTAGSGALVEDTIDWYAQDNAGNVWYFGEATKEYSKGVVTNTEGSWEAGVDGAQPGIVVKAQPQPGPAYRQEYRPGVALDLAKVLNANATVRVPGHTFHHVVMTSDINPLDPSFHERKWFASGLGLVKSWKVGAGHTETAHFVR
jgi:hypothetical protein